MEKIIVLELLIFREGKKGTLYGEVMQDDQDAVNWKKIEQFLPTIQDSLYPRISIIIPTCNDARRIGFTLENILAQSYPDFEVLVIDAASTDRTIEIVKSYRDERIRLSSVSDYNRYEMMNKGIFLSRGSYMNFLFPGDYYLSGMTLKIIMQQAVEHHKINLVYCGCLIRAADQPVKTLYRPLDLPLLKNGLQPTSLQSCWFHRSVFQEIGKFNTHYTIRGGFDLFCRFLLHGGLENKGVGRMLTDYDLHEVSHQMILRHFIETYKILRRNFGFFTALRWLFFQKDMARYIRSWKVSFQKAWRGKAP